MKYNQQSNKITKIKMNSSFNSITNSKINDKCDNLNKKPNCIEYKKSNKQMSIKNDSNSDNDLKDEEDIFLIMNPIHLETHS